MKHPAMDLNRRAKIFHSFDALKGFGDAITEQESLYMAAQEPEKTAWPEAPPDLPPGTGSEL